jgi:hypothetical protein
VASSPFFTVYVGTSGQHWHELPAGAHVPRFNPKRRAKLVEAPLMPGAINTADREFKAMTVRLVVEFYEDTAYALANAIKAVTNHIEDHEGGSLRIDDEEAGMSVYILQYDELNEPDVVFARYAKMKVATVTFPLLCTTAPYIPELGIGD